MGYPTNRCARSRPTSGTNMKSDNSPTALTDAEFAGMMREFESSSRWMIEQLKLKREAQSLPSHGRPVAENHNSREIKA